jgi:NitT/TauT family transport system permease protein
VNRFARWMISTAVPPLVAFAAVLAVWRLLIAVYDIKKYLLPGPMDVWKVCVRDASQLGQAFLLTAAGATAGFLLSLVAGIAIGCLFSQSRLVRTSLYPYAIFLQTVPIVAIAPLIVLWVGEGFFSVVLVSFIISLFPVITNATAGLLDVDPDLLDLFRLNNATRMQTLWKLRLPSAVPSIITGARISSGVAVVGAIVGEFFVSYDIKTYGLGYLIQTTSRNLQTDKLFATIILSTLLGLCIFSLVTAIGSLILNRWYRSNE